MGKRIVQDGEPVLSMYHASPIGNWESIEADGIRRSELGSVFLADTAQKTFDFMGAYGIDPFVLYEVDYEKLDLLKIEDIKDGTLSADGGVYVYYLDIPPSAVEFIGVYGSSPEAELSN